MLMNSELCLFCNRSEKKYKPETDKHFICSQCVQLMLSANQAELMRAYNKATEKMDTQQEIDYEALKPTHGVMNYWGLF